MPEESPSEKTKLHYPDENSIAMITDEEEKLRIDNQAHLGLGTSGAVDERLKIKAEPFDPDHEDKCALRVIDHHNQTIFSVNNDGNIGIRTSQPKSTLHINSPGDSNPVIISGYANTANARTALDSLPARTLIIGGPWSDRIYFYWKDQNGNKYKATLTGTLF